MPVTMGEAFGGGAFGGSRAFGASVDHFVFCDVDETLISFESIVDFFPYYFDGPPGSRLRDAHDKCLAPLLKMVRQGAPRETLNRTYYGAYAGETVVEVHASGKRWHDEREAREGFYVPAIREALAAHRRAGADIVLVSGSFAPLLDPIAAAVQARAVLATRLFVREGRYTGEIDVPMIGHHKADAVRAVLAEHPEVDPRRCYAYGDHPTDVPMLACVGRPVVVGSDPELRAWAESRGA
jgi:HAD superfamily hydrolase (TIGR01490 family)